ncbi:Thiol-disulfide interchange protein, contains DsbC and DsbD domains [Kaistia soli DSM 19436]|uniref:Thiol-disulfide interchange protein, contains DsbC and DsbD domains n=1 Tax=Kaistia soli DSM 19436 TaxID=1122133 RepID=A0A1M4VV66_9HYPH|nr:protein-disulfide reductase DsbD domain-containing protein [Kaistia soli]SHE72828.1 Thiol-disulfide interchange protein, contains DsbC and DsbD domains [Kaistia soli DSM 19436]
MTPRLLFRLFPLLPAILFALPAFAATGQWAEGEHARMRLVAARPAPGAPFEAAIELELDPGWKTYWRTPGDAGIPPRFDFSASTNAGGATIDYPAPERSDDGFSVSNVYHDRVLLPVRFSLSDPDEPARLVLAADLGVCKDICLPVSLSANLDVSPADAEPRAIATLAEARAALPGPGQTGVFEIEALRQVGGNEKSPEYEVEVAAASPDDSLLFVETPSDWYPATPTLASTGKGTATYRFAIDRKTASGPLAGASIRLTLSSGSAATTRAFTLGSTGAATATP